MLSNSNSEGIGNNWSETFHNIYRKTPTMDSFLVKSQVYVYNFADLFLRIMQDFFTKPFLKKWQPTVSGGNLP